MDCGPDIDALMFFDGKPASFGLYSVFAAKLLAMFPDTRVKIQKTQITFTNPRVFACVSFAKVRKVKQRSGDYIVISFGLGLRINSPRIDAATEPYPGRWTHHVTIGQPDEIDDELMCWIADAYSFSKNK